MCELSFQWIQILWHRHTHRHKPISTQHIDHKNQAQETIKITVKRTTLKCYHSLRASEFAIRHLTCVAQVIDAENKLMLYHPKTRRFAAS